MKYQVVPKYRETLSRGKDASTREAEADAWFEKQWKDRAWRVRNCPGKQVLAAIREWLQQSYKLTLTAKTLAKSISACPEDVAAIAAEVQGHFYGQRS